MMVQIIYELSGLVNSWNAQLAPWNEQTEEVFDSNSFSAHLLVE